jgi:hypothetical protein
MLSANHSTMCFACLARDDASEERGEMELPCHRAMGADFRICQSQKKGVCMQLELVVNGAIKKLSA